MEYQYKVIVSNRTVYKEFEIQPDMDRVKLGTGSSCEFRLNPEAFFTGIEMEFRKNGKSWNLECSDDVYFSRGDMRKLLSTEVRHIHPIRSRAVWYWDWIITRYYRMQSILLPVEC